MRAHERPHERLPLQPLPAVSPREKTLLIHGSRRLAWRALHFRSDLKSAGRKAVGVRASLPALENQGVNAWRLLGY